MIIMMFTFTDTKIPLNKCCKHEGSSTENSYQIIAQPLEKFKTQSGQRQCKRQSGQYRTRKGQLQFVVQIV